MLSEKDLRDAATGTAGCPDLKGTTQDAGSGALVHPWGLPGSQLTSPRRPASSRATIQSTRGHAQGSEVSPCFRLRGFTPPVEFLRIGGNPYFSEPVQTRQNSHERSDLPCSASAPGSCVDLHSRISQSEAEGVYPVALPGGERSTAVGPPHRCGGRFEERTSGSPTPCSNGECDRATFSTSESLKSSSSGTGVADL